MAFLASRGPHHRRGPRSVAICALACVATAFAAGPVSAAPTSDTVLVKIDEASAAQRADVGQALGTGAGRRLMAGWRAYRVPEAVTLSEARRLLEDRGAAAVQLDMPVQPLTLSNDPHVDLQWPLARIDAAAGWPTAAGAAPVTVAVLDTGVQIGHPDLAARLWTNPGETPGNGIDDDGNGLVDDVHGWNFADRNAELYAVADGDEHGTHVAGTIAATRNNSIGVAGVADNARIMALKFLKPDGGYVSDAITAIDYAVANGARVINASWAAGGYSGALCDAIASAGDQGALFVAAAGNDGTNNDDIARWPANCPAPSLVSVAATTSSNELASFSNQGAVQVDLGAPGESVLSTVPDGYGYMSGTSMAAPHVSGIAAAVLGLQPGLAPRQAAAAVIFGGDALSALATTTASGRRANLAGALEGASSEPDPDATPPEAFTALAPSDGEAIASPAPTFRWTTASDSQSGVAGYRLIVDGATVATAAAGSTSATPGAPLVEGMRVWKVVAFDGAGNERSTDARALVVDRTAPTGPTLSSPTAGAQARGPIVGLTWSPSHDAGSGVASYRVVVDGLAVAHAGPADRSARVSLTRGAHVWQVVAVDAAGNEGVGPARALTVIGVLTDDTSGGGAPRSGKVRVSARQLAINQRISQAALRRLALVEALRQGRPTPRSKNVSRGGGRVRVSAIQLRINQRIAQAAVRRANALAGRPTAPGANSTRRIRLSAGQLLINQRISQAAVRRANALLAAESQ